jgi:ABC-2 type transport system permease protein
MKVRVDKKMKYLKYYFRILSMCLMDQLANRANFITWAIINLFSVATYLVFFNVIFSGVKNINGWTQNQALAVYGAGLFVQGLGSMLFFCFMYFFSEEVAKGNFDFKMLKPIDTLFLAAVPYVDLEDITIIPLGLMVLAYSVPNISLFGLLLFLVLVVSALLIIFSTITFVESFMFKAVKADSFSDFMWSIVHSSKYPIKPIINMFPILGGALFPMVMIATVPAEALFGRYEWNWIIATIMLGVAMFIISRRLFQRGILEYSSASS